VYFLLLVRPFQPEDFSKVIEIEWQVFKEHDPYIYMELYENVSDGFYVAVVDNNVVGYVVGFISFPGKGRIFTLAVKEGYRYNKIGTKLLNAIQSVLWKQGAQSISLEARITNIPAHKFYAKHGFVPVWVEQGYYSDGEDAVVMKKQF
jgi:ribosomal-protein-alanine N-acetyltransferase